MVSIVDSEGTGRAYFTNDQLDVLLEALGARGEKGKLLWQERILLALQGIDLSLETLAGHSKTSSDKEHLDRLRKIFIDKTDPDMLESA